MNLFDVYPLFNIEIVKGKGCHVWDTEGTEYLDLYGGHAVISVGHSHPTYVAAITDQVNKLGFYSNSVINSLQQNLAVTYLPLNDSAAVEAELQKGDVSSVIIEGIQGVGGIQLPTDDFMKELRTLCTKYEACLILDEIQSGYGRSGKFFAHQYAGIKPDLITVAKGIGNGFPMSGLLISPMFEPVYGMLGTTFGGNHLACAAAIAVLEIMENEKLIDNAAQVGNFLIEELHKLPGIKEIRGRGLMIGIEFEESIKEVRSKLLFEEKVFTGVAGTNTIRLLPPLCLTMDEAKEFLTRFKKVLNA